MRPSTCSPTNTNEPPLLTKEAAAYVQIRIVAIADDAPVGAAPGLREALPTAARGSSNRFVSTLFAFAAPQSYRDCFAAHRAQRLFTDFDAGPAAPELPPTLVLNPARLPWRVINAVAFSPDASLVAVAGDVLRIWNLKDRKAGADISRRSPVCAGSGSLTSPGRLMAANLVVAVAGQKACLRIFDTADFTKVADVLAGHDGFVDRVKFSPRGNAAGHSRLRPASLSLGLVQPQTVRR